MHVLTVLCENDWMPSNFPEGWRNIGCSVAEFYYGKSQSKLWSNKEITENNDVNLQLLNKAKKLKDDGRLDLIFASIYDDVLNIDTAEKLRKLGVPMVNYHADMVSQWYRIIKTGKYFDIVACAQREHFAGLRRANINPYYMPMAANPPIQNQQISKQEHIFNGVLFLGSPWPYRQFILNKLVEVGVDLRIYGHNWWMTDKKITDYNKYLSKSLKARLGNNIKKSLLRKNIHDLYYYFIPLVLEQGTNIFIDIYNKKIAHKNTNLSDHDYEIINSHYRGSYRVEDYYSLVNGAAINLSFTHIMGEPGYDSERRHLRLREFEIPIVGGFILAQDCSQLRELFEVDKNIIVWDTFEDLHDKIQYYLNNPAERNKIAEASKSHCLNNHTWGIRFRKLLKDLGISYQN